jgi:subtilisin family serine protease
LWYQVTGGRQGAFVVATNASFGVEGASCDDFPVWGAMYDRLGEAGILTAASAVNVNRDVEISGDMPVDCPSDFLIGVTNVGEDDRRFTSSGFGNRSVDLAAPGEGSLTTYPGDRYGGFGSTSAAAPYVTGAISLLYATDCPALLAEARNQPARAARRVRQALLSSVRPVSNLQRLTVTGGIIDVAAARETLLAGCSETSEGQPTMRAVPNPATEAVTVTTTWPVEEDLPELLVYTSDGRRCRVDYVWSRSGTGVRFELGLTTLPAGYYVLELRGTGRQLRTPLLVF